MSTGPDWDWTLVAIDVGERPTVGTARTGVIRDIDHDVRRGGEYRAHERTGGRSPNRPWDGDTGERCVEGLNTGTLGSGEIATAEIVVGDQPIPFECTFHDGMRGEIVPIDPAG